METVLRFLLLPMRSPITSEDVYRSLDDWPAVSVLLATAMQRNGQLATLDSGIERLVPADARAHFCVIPV